MSLHGSIAAALAMCVLAQPALAGSLSNGDFASTLSHWATTSAPSAVASWVSDDAQGQPNSGAAELRDTAPGSGGAQVVLSQCVDLPGAGVPMPFAAKARVALEGEPGVRACLILAEHDAPGCPPGSYIGASQSHIVNNGQAQWQSFSGNFTPFDGSVRALNVRLAIGKDPGSGVGGSVRFDDILFGLPTPQLTRWTIDAGGGYLSGGGWVLQGTVGQPDAGTATATGSGIIVQAGFWFGNAAAPDDDLFRDGFES